MELSMHTLVTLYWHKRRHLVVYMEIITFHMIMQDVINYACPRHYFASIVYNIVSSIDHLLSLVQTYIIWHWLRCWYCITMELVLPTNWTVNTVTRTSLIPLWIVSFTISNIKIHDSHIDVMKWKYFPRYWPLVWGIHLSLVNSLHKGQWRGALMFPWSACE